MPIYCEGAALGSVVIANEDLRNKISDSCIADCESWAYKEGMNSVEEMLLRNCNMRVLADQ